MTRSGVLLVLGLAVSGVTSDFTVDPYRNEVNQLQNTQNVEGVYNDLEAPRAVLPKPCLRHYLSAGSQLVALPTQNDNQAQNNEISYGNLQTMQSKNLKPDNNYINQFNYQYGPSADVRRAHPDSASSSVGQYNNPGYGDYRNATPNQFDVANQKGANHVEFTEITAKTANLPNASSQLPIVYYGNLKTPQYSNNPAEYQNVDNNKYNQFLNSKPNQYKIQRSISEKYNDDDDDKKYAAFSKYDVNRRLYNKENSVLKNYNNKEKSVEKCQQTAGDSRVSDQDKDSRREKELYKYINQKLNEEYESKSDSQEPNDKVNIKHYDNSQYFNDVQSGSFSEDYSLPSILNINPASAAKKYSEDGDTQSAASRNDNQQLKNSQTAKTKEHSARDNQDEFADDNTENYEQSIFNNLQFNNVQAEKKQAQRMKSNQPTKYYKSVQLQDHDDKQEIMQVPKNLVQLKKGNKYDANEEAKIKNYNDNSYNYGKENNKRYKTIQSEKAQTKEPNGRNGYNQDENDGKVSNKDTKQPYLQVMEMEPTLRNNDAIKQNEAFGLKFAEKKQKYVSVENFDQDDPDKYLSDEDYEKYYKYDLSDVQSRRNNNPSDQNDSDCDSNEVVLNKPFMRKKIKNLKQGVPEVEVVDVTVRSGLSQKVLIGEHTRVCYACSSASNPTCLKPTRHTTVKYCHRGHDSCVTKLYKADGIEILTRDCGTSCNDNIIPGVTPKYAKCSVCHSDLCNGAFSLTGQNMFFICAMTLMTFTKYFI